MTSSKMAEQLSQLAQVFSTPSLMDTIHESMLAPFPSPSVLPIHTYHYLFSLVT